MYEDDIRVCHCVSNDCSKCPMRNIGTSGIRNERAFIDGELPKIIEHEKELIEQEQNKVGINYE